MTFTPCPKPEPRKAKGKKRPKRANPERRAKAFAYAYHSVERVEWVKTLGCCVGSLACSGPIDNAHTESGKSMGKKGPYQSIANLCRWHHTRYDEYEGNMGQAAVRDMISRAAASVQTLWLKRSDV